MMPDYRGMFDREYVGSWDLKGDTVVTIAKVEGKELTSQRGKNKKPVIYFSNTEKAFVCNKTNGKAIAGMYGNKTEDWVGKKITLYPTTTSAGGETVDCIRVRPTIPNGAK
jgi:hypothetical protein